MDDSHPGEGPPSNADSAGSGPGAQRLGILGLGVRALTADEWAFDCVRRGSRYAIVVGAGGYVLGLEHRWAARAQDAGVDDLAPRAAADLGETDAANDGRIID